MAVPPDRAEQPVREFRSFTHALIDLADWLTACDVDTVAMESTGVYWIPLYEILEARGFSGGAPSSMPGTSRTCPDARAMCPTASGSSGSIPLACCAAAFGAHAHETILIPLKAPNESAHDEIARRRLVARLDTIACADHISRGQVVRRALVREVEQHIRRALRTLASPTTPAE